MRWILEDLLTHETLELTSRGKWSIGRKDDPSETVLDDKSLSLSSRESRKADILVPITEDFEKTRQLFQKYGLTARVSRLHGFLGIDEGGPFFIDLSPNGTAIKGEETRICERGKLVSIHHGETIYLARTYPLLLRNEGPLFKLESRILEFFRRFFKNRPKDL